jgi:hypothetical protein
VSTHRVTDGHEPGDSTIIGDLRLPNQGGHTRYVVRLGTDGRAERVEVTDDTSNFVSGTIAFDPAANGSRSVTRLVRAAPGSYPIVGTSVALMEQLVRATHPASGETARVAVTNIRNRLRGAATIRRLSPEMVEVACDACRRPHSHQVLDFPISAAGTFVAGRDATQTRARFSHRDQDSHVMEREHHVTRQQAPVIEPRPLRTPGRAHRHDESNDGTAGSPREGSGSPRESSGSPSRDSGSPSGARAAPTQASGSPTRARQSLSLARTSRRRARTSRRWDRTASRRDQSPRRARFAFPEQARTLRRSRRTARVAGRTARRHAGTAPRRARNDAEARPTILAGQANRARARPNGLSRCPNVAEPRPAGQDVRSNAARLKSNDPAA